MLHDGWKSGACTNNLNFAENYSKLLLNIVTSIIYISSNMAAPLETTKG